MSFCTVALWCKPITVMRIFALAYLFLLLALRWLLRMKHIGTEPQNLLVLLRKTLSLLTQQAEKQRSSSVCTLTCQVQVFSSRWNSVLFAFAMKTEPLPQGIHYKNHRCENSVISGTDCWDERGVGKICHCLFNIFIVFWKRSCFGNVRYQKYVVYFVLTWTYECVHFLLDSAFSLLFVTGHYTRETYPLPEIFDNPNLSDFRKFKDNP